MTDLNERPLIVDQDADARFRDIIRRMGRNPDDRWISGYVDYLWSHERHFLEVREGDLHGKTVLELGCNYGAGAVVLAALGADVAGVDVDAALVVAARANVARYGFQHRVELFASQDGRRLPYSDATFDLVVCASVLEYVDAETLSMLQREVDRVLRPDGRIFVMGTSNRLWPREVHSGRWFINYVPLACDRWFGSRAHQRGVTPWRVRYGFGAGYVNLDWLDGGRTYVTARGRFPRCSGRALRVGFRIARAFGVTLGMLTPSMCLTLQKTRSMPRA